MPSTAADVSRDAVVVIPGIMGSELAEKATGRLLWGLSDPRWYVGAWTGEQSLAALRLTDAERAGDFSRIHAPRLLRVPAFAPLLRGVEPYHRLVRGVRRTVAHEDAVLEFPYDWRLPVVHNASVLAVAAERHLEQWRQHPSGGRDARLVLVAHSMGGLIAARFLKQFGESDVVRATVTLGTPFYGSAIAACLLSSGRGGPIPLPHQRLRDLAVTLPAVYDLLPRYRCIDGGGEARRLTVSDLAAVGADADLAAGALEAQPGVATFAPGSIDHVVGIGQPTVQSLTIDAGEVHPQFYTCEEAGGETIRRVDRGGDSTVHRDCASLVGAKPTYLPQTHAGLARSPEAVAFVRAVITERPLGPPLGVPVEDRVVSVDLPDVVRVGERLTIAIRGVDDPATVSCWIRDAATEEIETSPRIVSRRGGVDVVAVLVRPGIFRVEVQNSGRSPVTQLLMATR